MGGVCTCYQTRQAGCIEYGRRIGGWINSQKPVFPVPLQVIGENFRLTTTNESVHGIRIFSSLSFFLSFFLSFLSFPPRYELSQLG